MVALILAGLVVAAAVVGGVGYAVVTLFGEEAPGVGDCLTDGVSADEMDIVDCAASDAYWSVIGVDGDGDWTYGDFEAAQPGEVCADHPSSQQALWVTSEASVTDDTQGEVVCLEPAAGQQPPGGAGRPTR